MRLFVRYALLFLLVIGILLALVLTTPQPLLYTLEPEQFSSPFHENIDALKLQQLNSTTDILPGIQDLIDFSGPISLNIRVHDLGQAKRDMERFRQSQASIKNLIIRLDMNESEIQELEKDTALQKEILESLLNTSASLDTLQEMEIQYYGEGNTDMLTTIRLRGDALRNKVKGLKEQYRNATEQIVTKGTKIGLNVTKNAESQAHVDEIVRAIEQPETAKQIPVNTALAPGEERISLFLNPEMGTYRDLIEYMGISLTLHGNTTLRAEGKSISLYIDDRPVFTGVTDTFGYYNIRLPIEQLPAGTHTVYVRSPTSRSVNRTLTAIAVNSTTNLTVSRPDKNGMVNCTGTVIANHPVSSAGVQITWDQTHVIVTKTDADGRFMREIVLPVGSHTLQAEFSGDNFPIYPSKSDPVTVEVSLFGGLAPEDRYGWLVLPVIAIILLFSGAAAYYLWRMAIGKSLIPDRVQKYLSRWKRSPGKPDHEPPSAAKILRIPVSDPVVPSDEARGSESLIAYYRRVLKEQGLSTASRISYEQIAERIARDFRIKRYKSLTAREMYRHCKVRSYSRAFARFIVIYEQIRYGGKVSVKDQTIFENALVSTDEQTGGEDH